MMVFLYGAVMVLSAILLFSVQPLVGKLVLPVLGGASSVWITCILFFQFVVLLGYLYAHLAIARLGVRRIPSTAVAADWTPGSSAATRWRDAGHLAVRGPGVDGRSDRVFRKYDGTGIATVVLRDRSSCGQRSLFLLRREQRRQPGGAAGLSIRR